MLRFISSGNSGMSIEFNQTTSRYVPEDTPKTLPTLNCSVVDTCAETDRRNDRCSRIITTFIVNSPKISFRGTKNISEFHGEYVQK
jgi:hypothetical protein